MTHQSQQPLDEMNDFGPLTSTQGISHIKQALTFWGREEQFCHLGGESHDVDPTYHDTKHSVYGAPCGAMMFIHVNP